MDEPKTYEDFQTAQIVHHDSEEHILFIARVSSNQENTDPKLLRYLIEQNHWSPFEMVSACIEIDTTRDIGRQILRHRSFSFQEFSGRYAPYGSMIEARQIRFKGSTNRQGSVLAGEARRGIQVATEAEMQAHASRALKLYQEMIAHGVASECARAILPEGLTPTKMYMHGTLRSWIHYLRERMKLDPDGLPYAQREHYWLARDIYERIGNLFPVTWTAIIDMAYIDAPKYNL